MTAPDPTMARIGEGIALRERGDRAGARRLLEETWTAIGGEAGDPLHRCALAHSMADVCDDVTEELRWDERALAAAAAVTEEQAARAGMTAGVAAMYPSLHLNLADCHRRLGDLAAARAHLALGQAAAGALPDDGYGQLIRGGLDRLAARLR
jgi:hypothetical protein